MTKKRITLECSVTRYGKGDYRAHLLNASGYAINGRGTTEKAAKDDLAASTRQRDPWDSRGQCRG
jgi:hypothetical protein